MRALKIAEFDDFYRSIRVSLHRALCLLGELAPHRRKGIGAERNDLTDERVLKITSYIEWRSLLHRISERDHHLSDPGDVRGLYTLYPPLHHRVITEHVPHEAV